MTQTVLSNLVTPEVFNPAIVERTATKWEFIQSGIVRTPPPDMPIDINNGGITINLPFFQDLTGDDNIWDDADDITLNNIAMAQDTAVILAREKAWGATDFAAHMSGTDPSQVIADLVGDWWSRAYQTILIKTVTGAMGAVTANILDISALSGAAAYIDGESFIDATQKLGDRSTELTTIAMHSATEAWLRKNDLIADIRDSDGQLVMSTFQNRRVIIDDSMPKSGSVYTSYLFGSGAISFVDATFPNMSEVARHPEKKGGTDALYTRRKLVMHPRGVRWTPGSGVPAKTTPSNAELADPTNWTRVWEAKNIKIVQIKHKIGA